MLRRQMRIAVTISTEPDLKVETDTKIQEYFLVLVFLSPIGFQLTKALRLPLFKYLKQQHLKIWKFFTKNIKFLLGIISRYLSDSINANKCSSVQKVPRDWLLTWLTSESSNQTRNLMRSNVRGDVVFVQNESPYLNKFFLLALCSVFWQQLFLLLFVLATLLF